MGLDSLESHRLKWPSGLGFAKFRQCHALFQEKYCNSLLGLLLKGTDRLILLGLRVSHKVPLARSWSGCRRLNQKPLGHRQRISTPGEDRYLLRMMCINRFLSMPRFRAQLIRHTGCRPSVRSITRHLLAAAYHFRRLSRCPRLILTHHRHHRQWAKGVQWVVTNQPSLIKWLGHSITFMAHWFRRGLWSERPGVRPAWSITLVAEVTRARFLSLARSKLRLCSANHRAGYFSNLACDWLSIVWAYSEQETENGPRVRLWVEAPHLV